MPKPIEDRINNPEGLTHLSPSSINLFIKEPSLWIMKHFYGLTSFTNVYADRGTHIENGVNSLIENPKLTVSNAADIALEGFQKDTFFWDEEDITDEIEHNIPAWVKNTNKALEEISDEAPSLQKEIDFSIEGVKIKGFIDYEYDDLLVDLKTVNTVPSPCSRGARKGMLKSDKNDNVRQQSIYNKAEDKRVCLLFVSPDASYAHYLTDEELQPRFEEAVQSVKNIKKLLTKDIEDVIKDYIPDMKKAQWSFYWDDKLRKAAEDIWWDYVE